MIGPHVMKDPAPGPGFGSDHSVNEMATSSEGDASSQSLMSSEISDCLSSEIGLSSQSEEISSSRETDSQCSESNNCFVIHHSVEQPLFPGSDISIFQSHLLLYQFHLKHGLTTEGCMELLTLLKMHMPMSDNLPSSYTLKQLFAALFPNLISSIHYYCSRYHCYLEKSVSCSRCVGESTVDSFVSVPLQAQIKQKMEGKPIYNYTLFTQCIMTEMTHSYLLQRHKSHFPSSVGVEILKGACKSLDNGVTCTFAIAAS